MKIAFFGLLPAVADSSVIVAAQWVGLGVTYYESLQSATIAGESAKVLTIALKC
jgi:hypothetical protein